MTDATKAKLSAAGTVLLCIIALALGVRRLRNSAPTGAMQPTESTEATRLPPQQFYALRTSGHHLGPTDAPVNLVVFETFSCGKCAQFRLILDSIHKRFPEHLGITFKSFLPNMDRWNGAIIVHLAAECAGDQGKYLEFSRTAFANPEATRTADTWVELGKAVGLDDMARFKACTESHEHLAQLQNDTRVGSTLGVPGTPTSFLNGRPLVGIVAYPELDSLVGAILRDPVSY